MSATDNCGSSTGNLTLRTTGDDGNAPDWGNLVVECDEPGACSAHETCYNTVGDTRYRLYYCYGTASACADEADDCEASGSTMHCNEYWEDENYNCSVVAPYYDVYGKGPGEGELCNLCYKTNKIFRLEQCSYHTWGCT